MKKIILVLLGMTLFGTTSNGQSKWSAGYHTTWGNTNHTSTVLLPSPDKNNHLTNSVFINYAASKKLIIETSIGYTHFSKYIPEVLTTDNNSALIDYGEPLLVSGHTYNLSIDAKYSIYQTAKSNFFLIAGFNNTYTTQSQTAGTIFYSRQNRLLLGQNVFLGLGINYNLTKSIYALTQINGCYLLNNNISSFDNKDNKNCGYGLQIGAGYRF